MIVIRSIDIFYNEIISIANSHKVFPVTIDTFVYDPRFNDQCVIDMIKDTNESDDIFDEPDRFYRCLFRCVERMSFINGQLISVCDSDDVDDVFESGDFNYYTGFINDECPILYHESSHMFAFPSRIVMYSPLFQIEIHSYKRGIDIYETVSKVRDIFFIKNKKERINAIKDMLRNSDRPRIDI